MDKLPTNPGSVVKFIVQPEDYLTDPQSYDEPMMHVATLIPGHIDTDGEIHSAVWASAYVDDPEDKGNVFSEEFILARNPELVVETFPASERPDLVAMVNESGPQTIGLVVHIREHESEPESTFTFAPGFVNLDSEEFGDCMFTNSYGGFHASDVFESDPVFLYVPDKLI
jgi:hypothetical protein